MNSHLNIHPFNNKVETGLRILSILNSSFPDSFDLQTLVYLDYLTVHSSDLDKDIKSLHPEVPQRKGELLIRREIINNSLDIFISKGLIRKVYLVTGIEYIADERATPFIESLSEEYSIELAKRSEWIVEKFRSVNSIEFSSIMKSFLSAGMNDYSLNIISND